MIWTTSLLFLAGFALSGAAAENNDTAFSLGNRTVDSLFLESKNGSIDDLLLTFQTKPAISNNCPIDWDVYGQRCFKFIQRSMTWIEGEKYCLSIGGNLASVHSKEEYLFLQHIIQRGHGGYPIVWIGGSNCVEVKTWLWSDGSNFDYYNWNSGEPNNSGGHENCLQMNAGGEKAWNDLGCSSSMYIICSREM
ncbi:hypothetical protein AGOR_G00089080 [Albula goreensis]|uniref:C-type lectin domain-containing protein n=1 Tax=Albula goreensis TaxID=1534307 RepID=A0A8T3DKH8_9TELE|nr:hypothetical protein AGOR_G00089080 [Albula goreensis]